MNSHLLQKQILLFQKKTNLGRYLGGSVRRNAGERISLNLTGDHHEKNIVPILYIMREPGGSGSAN
jgi:hypothetical protein